MKSRIEVDHFAPNGTRRTTIMYLDKDEALAAVPASEMQNIEHFVESFLSAAEMTLAISRADVVTLVLCMLVEQQADADAYERESARRGLLAL